MSAVVVAALDVRTSDLPGPLYCPVAVAGRLPIARPGLLHRLRT